MGYITGINGERQFCKMCNDSGLQCTFDDKWYDFLVNNLHRVEVKTCHLQKRNSSRKVFGRFNFKSKENLNLAIKNNIWFCFLIEYKSQYICLGLTHAKNLFHYEIADTTKQKSITLSIQGVIKSRLKSFDSFADQIRGGTNNEK